MAFRNFRALCLLRVLALSASVCLVFYLLLKTDYYATIAIVVILTIYQIYALIQFVDTMNLELSRFLEAIRHADFSQSFSAQGIGAGFDRLRLNFNEVLDAFHRARAEKEEHYRYLQTVVQHVSVGLLCYQSDGRVELMNGAAQRLLKTTSLDNIESLESFSRDLVATLFRLKAGKKALVKVEYDGEISYLAISATELRMRGQVFTLASIHNIQSELEEKEMEAWQNLVRVLTHEIMNSITPISSLASTAHELLQPAGGPDYREIRPEVLPDILEAVQTIKKRSQGLLHFVETYRKMTRIPKPNFRIFPVTELFARAMQLMRRQAEEKSIELRSSVEPQSLELTADPELIEQVLINLVLNSIQALEGRPGGWIELNARIDSGSRTVIQALDNGPGILEEVKDKIFIPFFTTRQEGSGIGLSLARQIMRLHHGTISVQSRPNELTVFTLKF
ncbi:MAG: ATP-binding protein [Candidatus Glassbacteria bacterium]